MWTNSISNLQLVQFCMKSGSLLMYKKDILHLTKYSQVSYAQFFKETIVFPSAKFRRVSQFIYCTYLASEMRSDIKISMKALLHYLKHLYVRSKAIFPIKNCITQCNQSVSIKYFGISFSTTVILFFQKSSEYKLLT